jgi:hypothetical protein
MDRGNKPVVISPDVEYCRGTTATDSYLIGGPEGVSKFGEILPIVVAHHLHPFGQHVSGVWVFPAPLVDCRRLDDSHEAILSSMMSKVKDSWGGLNACATAPLEAICFAYVWVHSSGHSPCEIARFFL